MRGGRIALQLWRLSWREMGCSVDEVLVDGTLCILDGFQCKKIYFGLVIWI